MPSRLFHRLFAALLALSVALAASLGGRAFLFCPWMQEVRSHCCCKQEQPSPSPSIERADCCETKSVPAAQAASAEPRERSGRVPNAVASAALPAPRLDVPEAPRVPTVAAHERGARAGPVVPLYDLHCAYLI